MRIIITVKIARLNHWATDNARCLTACGLSWVRGKNRRDQMEWPNRRKMCETCAQALDATA